MNWEAIIWLGLLVAFLIAEAACPFHLISIWFAAGSLTALIISLLGGAIWLQVTVFLVVSGGLLALLWPLTKKYLKPKITATNVDGLIGREALVTAAVDNLAGCGQIKVNGMEWTARSQSGEPIEQGALVTIDRVEGVKAFVSKK